MSGVITYKLTDIFRFRTIAELPLNGVTFSKVLSGVGPWQGTLDVNDRGVQRANWITATAPWLAAFWIDIDGALIYGGPVTGRAYQRSTGIVTLTGFDMAGYLGQRLQAFDYANYTDPDGHAWAESGAPALRIAFFILQQAMRAEGSIPLKIVTQGEEASELLWITFSAPLAQEQTLASILSQIQELGYLIGIDYAAEVAYATNGRPTAQITLAYPKLTGGNKPVIDLDNVLDLQWPEDGTQQANRIVELAGATTDRTSGREWPPAQAAGYPLLETTVSHSALAPTEAGNSAALEAYAQGDLTTRGFSLVVPSITMNMFGTPSITDLVTGGDVRVRSLPHAGDQPPTDPRFPAGLNLVQRVVRVDGTIPDEGVPTMVVALNEPPSTTPVEPAFTTGNGPPAKPEPWEKREEERHEEEEKPLGTGTLSLTIKRVVDSGKDEEDLTFQVMQELPLKNGETQTYVATVDGDSFLTTITGLAPAIPGGTTRLELTQTVGPHLELGSLFENKLTGFLAGIDVPKTGETVTLEFDYEAFA